MQKPLLLILCLAPCWLTAQTVDSVAIRQVDSLIQVSQQLADQSQFDKALEISAIAEKIALLQEAGMGRESAAYGRCANNRGEVFYAKGDYIEAEKWYLEAKAIHAQARGIGREHRTYAGTLNNLGNLYFDMGNYEKTESLYLEAKAIREKVSGKEHPHVATSLNNLAILYKILGNYENAEQCHLEAKAIREKVLGKKHPDYAASLNNLASLYMLMGNYENAQPLYVESKEIREQALGKEHPDYAASLSNLAWLYSVRGNYTTAEPLYIEAKDIWGKALGIEHPDYAYGVNNLGNLYIKMGNYEKAEPLLLEARAIREKVLGKDHPDYNTSLLVLANLNLYIGAYEKAEPLLFETKVFYEKVFGKEHQHYAGNLETLAKLYTDWGKLENAAPFHIELAEVNQSLLRKAVRHLSEREMGKYLNKFSERQDQALSFAQLSGTQKVVQACFDNALFYKGFILQGAAQLKRLALYNPAAAEKLDLLKSFGRRLASMYAQPAVRRDSATVAQLETQVNDLEKELARTVADFGQAILQVKWQQVQAALKPNEAAIEFVSYRFYQKKQTDSTLYAALVLLPGTDAPQFIPLFEEKQLVAFLKTDEKPQPTFYNDLYAAGKTGSQLYDLIWKPIVAKLPASTTIYASPSGLLHRLNLGAIPTPDGKTLAEKHRLTTLGSTRQLVVPSALAANQNATAQLYGGIQYDATPVVAANTDTKTDDLAARRGSDFAQNDSTLRGENWNYLRWTEVEITAAAEVMNGKGIATTVKKGAEATEESFKTIGTTAPSPRILHVATHGFFFPDPKGKQVENEKTFKVSENPMIRSGLVMAGGNHAWKTGKPARPDMEDGILTAYEISQMNLSNTELVVLSACETGLGDLVGNEGVYGLQRAFKIAGARYLIMSLWQVPDFQTQVFMSTFYKHWLTDEKSVPEAFRATQSELRAKYDEAFKWAGFVLVE